MSRLLIERVLAPNPGPFTGPGTNSWILSSAAEALVIDPGPRIAAHERAIIATLGTRRPVGVVVTHGHEDHAPLANPLAAALGVPAYGHSPAPDFDPDLRLVEGGEIAFGDDLLRVVFTPGHADDHLCFSSTVCSLVATTSWVARR